MPILVDAAENDALDAVAALAAYASLHSAYSASGANELAGGSPAYARQALTWGAAASGAVSISGTEQFNVPPSSSLAWIGLWSAVTLGTFYGMIPNGGYSAVPFTATTGDTFTAPGHGLSNGHRVVLFGSAGSLPTGVTEGTIYWVVGVSGDTFQVSTTQGGSAVDLTAAGSGVVQRIIVESYELQGTFDLTNATVTAAS